MPIPKGFVEVHPLEQPPFVKAEWLRHGAIVKYLRTREASSTDDTSDFTRFGGFLSRTGEGQLIHEFVSRGGVGLPFKLLGDPALNARLCAIKEQWVIWLQWVSLWTWDVGAAYDLIRLRELQRRMSETDDDFDRAILAAGGSFTGGTSVRGIEDITSSVDGHPITDRARRRAQKLKAPHEQQRARALLRQLLAIGSPPIAHVRREFRENGLTVDQLLVAVEEVNAEVVMLRGHRERHLRIPTLGTTVRARVVGKSVATIRKHIAADIAEQETRERSASSRLLDSTDRVPASAGEEPSDQQSRDAAIAHDDDMTRMHASSVAVDAPPLDWLREQLLTGARRLSDLRRAMPAPEECDQEARDHLFLSLVRSTNVLVRGVGPRRQRGFWLELAPEDLSPDESFVDAVRAAMRREGSPHVAYPIPKAWF